MWLRDSEIWIYALTAVLSGIALCGTGHYPRIPALFPRIVSGTVLLLSLYCLAGRVVGRKVAVERPGRLPWWLFALGMFGYLAAIYLVGFAVATFGFLWLAAHWLGEKRLLVGIRFALLVSAALVVGMKWLFRIPIPGGLLF